MSRELESLVPILSKCLSPADAMTVVSCLANALRMAAGVTGRTTIDVPVYTGTDGTNRSFTVYTVALPSIATPTKTTTTFDFADA